MTASPATTQALEWRRGDDAAYVSALLAVDPVGLGGVILRSLPGPATDSWLADLRRVLPRGVPWRRLPLNIDDDRMLGGLDIAASLAAGRAVLATGLLAEADGGCVVVPMAERLQRGVAARLSAVIDRQAVVIERDGIARIQPSRFCTVLVDEGLDEDEFVSPDLAERLAFYLDAPELEAGMEAPARLDPFELEQVCECWQSVTASDAQLKALCGVAMLLGVDSLRAPSLALRAARASAALDGRTTLNEHDVQLAVRLVLAPRATRVPEQLEDEQAENQPEDQPAEPPPSDDQAQSEDRPPVPDGLPEDMLLEAVKASLPHDLLEKLQIRALRRRGVSGGRGGPQAKAKLRGRPIGVRPGRPVAGERLHLPSTLKSAAPWQRLRAAGAGERGPDAPRLMVRVSDFRIQRFKARRQTTHIFVVDASGSSAVHRLAEAKGAIELLLAQSYVRRDQVALIAFRGSGAEQLLAPTRAVARARRELAALPGGGGTPLAAGVDVAHELALEVQRKGHHPVIVVMTDGRANVARDGSHGHEQAHADALLACKRLSVEGWTSLLVDTSRRPRPRALELATAMGGQYLPLPNASAGSLSAAVQAVAAA